MKKVLDFSFIRDTVKHMKKTAIQVTSREESKALQNKLFTLGYKWSGEEKDTEWYPTGETYFIHLCEKNKMIMWNRNPDRDYQVVDYSVFMEIPKLLQVHAPGPLRDVLVEHLNKLGFEERYDNESEEFWVFASTDEAEKFYFTQDEGDARSSWKKISVEDFFRFLPAAPKKTVVVIPAGLVPEYPIHVFKHRIEIGCQVIDNFDAIVKAVAEARATLG